MKTAEDAEGAEGAAGTAALQKLAVILVRPSFLFSGV